ncbi:MAG: bifunctional 4-hydroxy-3-methylbut-2-enyl diphosphate reductase/30S ribosomal protein S1 [Ruminococcus sp.]|nr:bifunctional 4-hydroxy-3-methylbut-2-enyl diphosphate reductase/30S ribosomal protein S1 [Ruminococcus sp.]
MNKVTVAKSAGFCFGVDRAVKMVYNELSGNTKVATLGPIIHNQDVVNDMNKKGARVVETVDELLPEETVVIRSHGVGRAVYDRIAEKGCRMLDATCPFVAKIHKIVAEKSKEGYMILIAGDVNHPEIQGIIGHCEQNFCVFKDNVELKHVFEKNENFLRKKLAFVAQTTYNIIEWEECLKVIPKGNPDIVIFDTICSATDTRQSDAAELAKKSDVMLVVGGRHSSNTVKLFEVCSRYCKTYHIENSDELSSLMLPCAGKIGITAGASTPAYIIEEVQTTMTENVNLNAIDEEIDFAEALDQSFKKIHTGEKVEGLVVSVDNAEITVDLGTKHTGYVKLEDLTDDSTKKPEDIVSVGDKIDLIVIKVNDSEGTVALSKRKVDEQAGYDTVVKAKEEGTVLEGTVSRIVNKGVTLNYMGVRIFIPASQTGLPRGAELDQLNKQKVQFKIIEVDEGGKKRAVGSIKAVDSAKKEEAKAAFWADAEIGKTYVGKVKSLTSFGAFVDLGGIDGMVHISELSWKRIKHPSEVVAVGDTLEVYIKDLNAEENRISLGFKKAEDNPWEIFKSQYAIDDVVKATIVSTTSFGAFAQIIDGVDGLIHISQLADKKVENVKDIVSVGDVVDVKIIDIDDESKRISISMRALLEDAADAEDEDYEDEE